MERTGKKTWLGSSGNALVLLIAILAIVFCIFKFLHLTYFLSNNNGEAAFARYYNGIFKHFILPTTPEGVLSAPWTLFTYMFMHDGVFHLIGNLIWLWIFGYILQDLTGAKSIFPLFIYGALCGAVVYLVSMNLFPGLKHMASDATLEGASAGIMAIAVATTILAPNYRFFPMINGGIPLWVITVFYLIIDIAMIPANDNAGGHISHIGGAAFGAVYMWQWKKGHDWGSGMNRFFNWFGNLFNPDPSGNLKAVKGAYYYETKGTAPYKKMPNLTQKRIDAILDKIGENGYENLTEEEKAILKKAAEDDNL